MPGRIDWEKEGRRAKASYRADPKPDLDARRATYCPDMQKFKRLANVNDLHRLREIQSLRRLVKGSGLNKWEKELVVTRLDYSKRGRLLLTETEAEIIVSIHDRLRMAYHDVHKGTRRWRG